MAASDASSDRSDPWYVKVAFGLFLSALVGFLAVLYGLPATQRVSELRSGRAHPRRTPRAGVKMTGSTSTRQKCRASRLRRRKENNRPSTDAS